MRIRAGRLLPCAVAKWRTLYIKFVSYKWLNSVEISRQLQRVFFCHTDCFLGNQDCKLHKWTACAVHLPDLWINKFWPLRHLFATHLIDPVYDDCSMKKQPISTAVVLEFRELLKWITKWYWNLSELYECKHICHRDRFIFYVTSECFIMPASLSYWL